MSLLHSRSRRVDPYLEWKVRIFSVAAVVGLCGIYFDERWMTAIAIVLLATAMLLRFLPGAGIEIEDDEPSEEGGAEPE